MSEYDFKAGGALFRRDKKSENAPEMGGEITLDPDLLAYLNDCAGRGEPLKLEIAGWSRESARGVKFLSLKPSRPFKKDGGVNTNGPSPASMGLQNDPARQAPVGGGYTDLDDDIPFNLEWRV